MSDPSPLIVPIEVQAMVLNEPNVSFTRATMSYGSLDDFQSPSPGAFKKDDVDFAKQSKNGIYVNHGVYLRWVLPKALVHGVTNDKNEIEFPPVPDRWLVMRLYRSAAAGPKAAPELKAWVVQSNYAPNGTSAFVDSSGKRMHIGRKVELSPSAPWKEPDGSTGVVLRAIAEGNPAFATYQPFNEDVFSLHDDLATQQLAAGTLSYFVIGWYSDPAKDILAEWTAGDDGKGFAKRLAELQWSASDRVAGARASIYQGMVFSVPWTPWAPGGTAPPSPKDGLKPHVAFGNTSVDGIVAFTKAALEAQPMEGFSPQQAADLLEAFQYNMLPMLGEAGAEDMLEQKIRSQWFGSAHAGRRWAILDAETAPDKPPPAPVPADELARQDRLLAALNADQSALDELSRERMGVQRRLFELWWKKGIVNRLAEFGSSPPWGIDSIDQMTQAVVDQAGEAQSLSSKCDEVAKRISTAPDSLKLPETRVLKDVAAPRFWAPADPVVVVSNTAHTMKIDPDTVLACRWPVEVLPSPIEKMEPAMPWTGLPALAHPLFSECFLLDPANASLPGAVTPPSGSSTSIPPGFVPAPWKQQPWQPLYLDWEIEWYPIPLQRSDGTPNWKFNGLDYEFVPGMTVPEPKPLQGRSILTPKPSFELKARIDQFLTDNKGTEAARQLEAVEGIVQAVDQWDFLSQALSGLNTLLAGWRPDPTQNPGANDAVNGALMADLIGDAPNGPPDPKLYDKPAQPVPSAFEGVRGGQFYLKRLTVVDVFGQTLEIVTSDESPQFYPLVADGLAPANPIDTAIDRGRFVELPPRLLQPARLNFQFVQGNDNPPILGWILPNHLDSGLAVHGAGGKPHGELSQAPNASDKPDWKPAPGSPYATLAELAAKEPQLGGFVLSLQSAGAQAFGEFLNAVDETLWTVDVAGNANDTFLATLVGRPLAVVAAKLSLELQAQAWTDPEWPYTFANPQPQPRFLDHKFSVRLGDLGYRQDGLIGYFVGGQYSQFHTVHPAPSPSGYLAPIGPGNYIELAFAAQGPGAPAALTLIMDPRAGVHAQCGLFPVKEVTLVPQWVDDALAAMEVTFRAGPVLAGTQQVIPKGKTTPETGLLLPSPAQTRGSWSWIESDGKGNWTESPLAPVSGVAAFSDTPPALREGLLKLTGGLGK